MTRKPDSSTKHKNPCNHTVATILMTKTLYSLAPAFVPIKIFHTIPTTVGRASSYRSSVYYNTLHVVHPHRRPHPP
ncbi:hypothetical protein CANTEDRAFT_129901 [Yamadazyma tenuis ATCC 10573]|uniref:Uncharacterized protein n=1 Tax=Candida tenuis (strain ATCC 10573 / BCRC 21748 / CBS 615 / JCM 9827 / NBRC 10315 / NRRL Y-1498 / VKM Y-70) TaxID=590646 RepID=G3B2I3_CANTC|nr:uncharacterized protein CANTEDRAFT_129901 [Yamadazyma tenuis ATCC 10573]EGV64681.1 hypothetical protein CANTEDRAFT_129901 [Yamadazyma tenuis ATCC 10573]